MNEPLQLTVLMACHDRRETTLRSLEALHAQEGLGVDISLRVFLLDDGCRDGTGDAVRASFPGVRVLRGNGQCYWAGGMRLAWEAALREGGAEAFLWLNDDTVLDPDALACFLRHHREQELGNRPGILVGAARDPETGLNSYSGLEFSDPGDPLQLRKLPPDGTLRPCVSFNGNAVWIPESAFRILGGMDPLFVHAIGDWDYGLRAHRAGIPQWILPREIASCALNRFPGGWHARGLSLAQRYRLLLGPKGLPPRIWFAYCRRHGRWHWMLEAFRPYLGILKGHLRERGSSLRH